MSTAKQVQAAKERGFDRAQTLFKQDVAGISYDLLAGQLYPDSTELQNACSEGLREGWEIGAR
jgi:hypothetical protein